MLAGTRKTRIVCISDTHNSTFKLPAGDVLIHAGDLTKQGTLAELKKSLEWIEKADFEVKIVIAGNHDITLDEGFYTENGGNFHSQSPQNSQDCQNPIQNSTSIIYLKHESRTIRLSKPDGPHTECKVFGSPFSRVTVDWAFQYRPEQAYALWNQIPLDTDILITHGPPKYHCDESKTGEPAGCEALKETLWRVRPLLSICGHVHEARGAELITWDLDCPNVQFKEKPTTYWIDSSIGTKKQALLDLTLKGGEPIDWTNEAVVNHRSGEAEPMAADGRPRKPSAQASVNSRFSTSKPAKTATISKHTAISNLNRSSSRATFHTKDDDSIKIPHMDPPPLAPSESVQKVGSAIRGRGGSPSSGRSDREALAGRSGRKQTCVINAAIMATSWPYKGTGGERYNKPIVVDVDLPVWSGGGDLG